MKTIKENEKLYVLDETDPDNGATYVFGGLVIIGPKDVDIQELWGQYSGDKEVAGVDEFIDWLVENQKFRELDEEKIEYQTVEHKRT